MPHSAANCSVLCITLNSRVFTILPNASFSALGSADYSDIWLPSIAAMANSNPTCTRRTQQPNTPTNAGNLEATGFTPSTDSSVGVRTFNRDMSEVPLPKKRPLSKEEQKRTKEMRSRGACNECRSKKRRCKFEHPPSKRVAKKRGRGHPHSSTQAKISQDSQLHPRLISEMPPLYGWTNDRQASLANLNLLGPDPNNFPGNRRPHGIHKPPRPSVPLVDQAQDPPTDTHQDQPPMIPPGQPYPLYPGPYLDDHQFPVAVSPQFVGTAWLTPYLPDPKVFYGNPCLPYVQGYMDYPEDYVTRNGFHTNIGPRLTEFSPYELLNDGLLHLDNSHQIQEISPPYHYGFCRDRSGMSHSTHQTQETTVLTRTQGISCVPGESPRLLQARLQKSDADPKALAGNSPAYHLHGILGLLPMESSTDQSPPPLQSSGNPVSSQDFPTHSRGSSPEHHLHGILGLLPMEFSTDQSPLPLQSSGNPVSSQGFPTHSRGSSPENPGFDWIKI